jgi:hypothetical protein
MAPDKERPAPTRPAKRALGTRRERMIVFSVSVPAPFRPRIDSRRIEMERWGFTFTLPIIMERIMTRIKMRPRRAEIRRTFFRVRIFIKESLNNDQ